MDVAEDRGIRVVGQIGEFAPFDAAGDSRHAYLPPMLFSGFHSPFSTLYIVMPPFFRSPLLS